LYALQNNIMVIQSRMMRWSGHAACMGGMKNAYNNLYGNLKRRDQLKDLDGDDNLVLEWILGK